LEAGATDVRITFADKNGSVLMRIEDNGAGCSDENLKFLGSPFFTTKKDKGGTGLGLALTTSIIESHNGTMLVSNSNGSGTGLIFRITFPKTDK
jgi:signal transduction histidine kinase